MLEKVLKSAFFAISRQLSEVLGQLEHAKLPFTANPQPPPHGQPLAKVSLEPFQRLAGSKGSALGRLRRGEIPLSFESARKRVNFSSVTKKREKTTSGVFSLVHIH